MWLSAIRAFGRVAIAPRARQKCGASLVVTGDHNDSEHNHDSGNNFDDKPEATTLLPLLSPSATKAPSSSPIEG